MKISELMEELKNFKEKYGDIIVYCFDNDYGHSPTMLKLDMAYIENDDDQEYKVDVCSLE